MPSLLRMRTTTSGGKGSQPTREIYSASAERSQNWLGCQHSLCLIHGGHVHLPSVSALFVLLVLLATLCLCGRARLGPWHYQCSDMQCGSINFMNDYEGYADILMYNGKITPRYRQATPSKNRSLRATRGMCCRHCLPSNGALRDIDEALRLWVTRGLAFCPVIPDGGADGVLGKHGTM